MLVLVDYVSVNLCSCPRLLYAVQTSKVLGLFYFQRRRLCFQGANMFFFFCPFTFPHFHSNIFQSLFRNLLTFVSLYINCMICIPYTVTWLLFCYWKTQKLQQKVARNADGRLRHRLYCRSLQLLCSNDIEFLPNKAEVCIDTDQRSFLTVVGIWDFIRKQTWTE